MTDFKEIKLREPPACMPIPPVLLPRLPANPVIGAPAWLSPIPRICRLKRGDCISLDDVVFRTRKGYIRTTPRGFPNDGMSYGAVVRLLTVWDNYDPETLRSGITHDCPYSMHDHLCHWPITRKEADIDLLDGLHCEIDSWAWIKYRVVRRVGWIPWGIKTRDPLVVEWIECLYKGGPALDKWIKKVIRTEGV